VSDVFDTELANLVREFQRQHRLTVDGIAGVQTQIALASAVAGSDAPLLYVADTHGG
jgi:murein L,D-transpeptidase YcbB/YkuD